jgi:transposase
MGGRRVQVPVEEAVRLYRDGLPMLEIAARFGVGTMTIQRRLREAGVVARTTKDWARGLPPIPVDEDVLRQLAAQQMSTREIGEALGVSEETARRRMRALGIPRLPGKARPERNHFWRGGYSVDEDGYILKHQPDHPHAVSGYVRQHRLVMEARLGRYLEPDEVVDHKNRDTSDNDPGNLQLFPSNADHLRDNMTGSKNLPAAERERRRREAVRRARRRVAAILAASGTGALPSP